MVPLLLPVLASHQANTLGRWVCWRLLRCPTSYHDNRPRRRRLSCAPQVELRDFGSPLASKPNVVAYDFRVIFASDYPADATRQRAPGPISTTQIDEAFVHEMSEQLVGLVFAQADVLAYACERVKAPPRAGK